MFNIAQKTRSESDQASNLAMNVFNNATKILETLDDFDELVSSGKEKLKQAELSRSQTEDNNRKMTSLIKQVREKLSDLNFSVEEIKRASTKSSNILNETFIVSIRC